MCVCVCVEGGGGSRWYDYCLGMSAPANTLQVIRSFSPAITLTSIINSAAESGNLELLKMLHSKGFNCDIDGARKAFRNGKLEVVQWLYKQKAVVCDVSFVKNARIPVTGLIEANTNVS